MPLLVIENRKDDVCLFFFAVVLLGVGGWDGRGLGNAVDFNTLLLLLDYQYVSTTIAVTFSL